ncbi:ankyrin repeat-containing domain protein [Phaeosphaeria sp. MPI-PUGE-AT-0046c]|nr:ankyrin repeat-containing domain protein [Phaeosphaeria sp. MPI-PUGE-AT-0046c]
MNKIRATRNDPFTDDDLFRICVPLIEAAIQKNSEMVALLARFGARLETSINQIPKDCWHLLDNPFLPAFLTLNEDIVSKLLDLASPSNNLTRQWADKCLLNAIRSETEWEDVPIRIAVLLSHHAENTRHLHFLGAFSKSILEFCMQRSITTDKHGFTILHVAVGDRTAETAQDLMARNVDMEAEDFFGMTPLLEAIYYGHTDAIRILLSNRANLQKRAGFAFPRFERPKPVAVNRPPRTFCYNRRLSDVETFASNQWPALNIAAHRGFSFIVKILIQHGAELAARDRLGQTALDVAVRRSNYDTAFTLLGLSCPFGSDTEAAPKLWMAALDSMQFDALAILEASGVSAQHLDDLQDDLSVQLNSLAIMRSSSLPRKSTLSNDHSDEVSLVALYLCRDCQEAFAEPISNRTRSQKLPETISSCKFCQLCFGLQAVPDIRI